jgi:hypothetical protein
MITRHCPHCESSHPCHVVRGDYIHGVYEWCCSHCGGRWVVRMDHPGETFACRPADRAEPLPTSDAG